MSFYFLTLVTITVILSAVDDHGQPNDAKFPTSEDA